MRMHRRLFLAALSALGVAGPSFGQTSSWNYPSSGSGYFQTSSNWTPNGVPGTNTTAQFTQSLTTTVNFSASVSNYGLVQQDGNVTLAIGSGQTYNITGTNGFTLGGGANQDPIFTVSSGTLNLAANNIGAATGGIAVGSNSNAAMLITGNGTTFQTQQGFSLGMYGNGDLSIQNGATGIMNGYTTLGTNSAANGQIAILSGTLYANGGMAIGIGGDGTLTLNNQDGSQVLNSASNINIGIQSGSGGLVQLQAGIWNHSGGSIYVGGSAAGSGGTGSLSVFAGSLNITGSTNGITILGSSSSNHGTVSLSGGTINTPNFTLANNYAAFSFTGGTLQINGGTLNLNANYFVVDGANPTLIFNGPGSTLANGSTSALAIGPNNSGKVVVEGGATLSIQSLYLGYSSSSTATLIIDGAGTMLATNPQFAFGIGSITVQNGGKLDVSSNGIYISANASSLTVTGAGSQVTTGTQTLTILGNYQSGGTNNLSILNGASATLSEVDIGNFQGATASMIIGGTGSIAAVNGPLNVGGATSTIGNGILTVNNGGTLTTSGIASIGSTNSSSGIVTINNATWNHSGGSIYIGGNSGGAGGAGSLTVTNLGVLNVTGAGNGITILGTGSGTSNGSLTISNAGTIATPNLTVSQYGSFNFTGGLLQINGGTLTFNTSTTAIDGTGNPILILNGAGANIANGANSSVLVGANYGGLLEVMGGATPSIGTINLGGQNSTSNLVVLGAGTTLNITNSINIYNGGITVQGGGKIIGNTNAFIDGSEGSAASSLLVTGAGSQISGIILNCYNNATFSIQNGAIANLVTLGVTGNATSSFTVGGNGATINVSGTTYAFSALTINTGGTLNASTIFVTSGGNLIVNGGTFTAAATYVYADGTASFSNGTITTSGIFAIGVSGLDYYGTVNLTSGTWTHSGSLISIGGTNAGTGTLNVTGGSLTVSGYGGTNGIAIYGTGTGVNNGYFNLSGGVVYTPNLTVNPNGVFNFTGGTLWINGGTLSLNAASSYNIQGPNNPTLVFNGVGSSFGSSPPSFLYFGNTPGTSGSFQVIGGATPSIYATYFGYGSNATGTLLVDGSGTDFITYPVLGYQGNGTATVQNGGMLDASSNGIYLGGTASALTVTGVGSLVTTGTQSLRVVGSASVSVLSGASAIFGEVDLGSTTGVNASMTVSGAGSTATLSGTLYVGGSPSGIGGTGTVTIGSGGTLACSAVQVFAGSTLNLNGGSWTLTSLTNSGTINFNSGSYTLSGAITNNGLLAFNTAAGNWTAPQSISGTGSLQQSGSGTTTLTGTNTYSGGTTITGGILQIGSGGTSGRITGNVSTGTATNYGALEFDRSDNVAFSGTISGNGSIVQAGFGTLTLSGINTYSGGTTITQGTIQVASDSALGTGPVTSTALGTLIYTGNTVTSRTFNLNDGTLATTTSATVTFMNAQVGGGYLTGNFATVVNSSSSFVGDTFATSSNLTLNGGDSLRNGTNYGQITIGATNTAASLVRFTNGSGGQIALTTGTATNTSLLNVSDFVSNGFLTVSNGPSATNYNLLTNIGTTAMNFGGGSQTFIGTPATAQSPRVYINLNGQNAIVAGGLFVNNGGVYDGSSSGSAVVIAEYGALVKGAGYWSTVPITRNGGVYQAGNSPGLSTSGTATISGPVGGYTSAINFEINNATGVAGPSPDANNQVSGWSQIQVQRQTSGPVPQQSTGNLTWIATSSDKLTINLQTLVNPTTVGNDVPGAMANFNPSQSYQWLFLNQVNVTTASGPLGTYTGPTDDATLTASVNFVTTSSIPFANATNGGAFGIHYVDDSSLANASRDFYITFTPAPEPAHVILIGAALLGLFQWRRKNSRTYPRQLHRARCHQNSYQPQRLVYSRSRSGLA